MNSEIMRRRLIQTPLWEWERSDLAECWGRDRAISVVDVCAFRRPEYYTHINYTQRHRRHKPNFAEETHAAAQAIHPSAHIQTLKYAQYITYTLARALSCVLIYLYAFSIDCLHLLVLAYLCVFQNHPSLSTPSLPSLNSTPRPGPVSQSGVVRNEKPLSWTCCGLWTHPNPTPIAAVSRCNASRKTLSRKREKCIAVLVPRRPADAMR